MDAPTECSICVETYNRTTRSPITCVKCDFVCCKTCFKRGSHNLQCMVCHVEFDRTSLQTRLGSSWMRTTYRDIREGVLYEQEKGMFPATQELIEGEIEIERLESARDKLDVKYDKIRKSRIIPLAEFRHSMETMVVKDVIDKYFQLTANIELVDEQLHEERASLTRQIEDLRNHKSHKKRTYVLGCTSDNCKGMLSNENKNKLGHYVCSICDTTTCCECKMNIGNDKDHDCDPDILKTVQFLQTTSKPCPSCGIPIHKISGCSQMFCTGCHASFDWNTLRLNNGVVHNPYHAAWLRENRNRPRELGDVQCGRELSIDIAINVVSTFEDKFEQDPNVSEKENHQLRVDATYLLEAMRVAIHHHFITIPSLNRNQHGHHTNQQLRVSLLRGFIDEDTFRREIQRRDKANARKNDLMQIVLTYRDSITDTIWGFVEKGRTKSLQDWIDLVKQVRELEEYVNNCFRQTAVVFGSSIPYTIMTDRSFR